jgi:hypothetical protein
MKRALFALLLSVLSVSAMGCSTSSSKTGQSFYQNLVACTKADKMDAAAQAALLSCVASATSGAAAACLTTAVPAIEWTADELACLAQDY